MYKHTRGVTALTLMAVTFLLFFTVWPPMYISVKIYVACFWAFYQLDQIIIVFCVFYVLSKLHWYLQDSLIPWTAESDGLQFMGSQRVVHDWGLTHNIRFIHVILCFSNLIFFHCLNKPWFIYCSLAEQQFFWYYW